MGMLFDNVGITDQSSFAAAGRLDSTFTGGGAGSRSSINQSLAFGRDNSVDSSGTGNTSEIPWLWILAGLAAIYLTVTMFKRKT